MTVWHLSRCSLSSVSSRVSLTTRRIVLKSSGSWLLLLCVGLSSWAAAEIDHGVLSKNVQSVSFLSKSLGEQRKFNIVLPTDYDTSTSRYPVLYLLHGYGDNETGWVLKTNLSGYAAAYKLIIVVPDASGSYFLNSASDPKARFEDYIVADLIDYVDTHYRSIPLPHARAIAGLSMGGYGAIFLGLKHYDLFTAIGSFSGALAFARRPPGKLKEKRQLLGPPGSREQNARDPFVIVDKVPLSQMPLIYIACGGQDFLLEETRTFVDLLSKKKIPYEYREISLADHNYDFWDEQVSVFLDILMTKPGFTR